jgi:hypothetical protein
MNIEEGKTEKTGKWGRYDRVRAAHADAEKGAETRPGSATIEVWQYVIAWSRCNCFEYTILLLIDRAPIIICYCLNVVQLLLIYCTIIAWSRSDYSMLLLGRDATASNILYYYCLIALRL